MKTLNHFVLGLILVIGSLLGSRAQPAPAADATPGRVHQLTVTVRDAATKEPVSGAEIATWESRDVTKATTDASGAATLSVPLDVPFAERIQRFDLSIVDPRYATRSVMFIATAGRVRESLPATQEIQLSVGIAAGGVVRDEHGAPIGGAKIILYGTNYKGFTMGGDTKSHQEYSSVSTNPQKPILTDAEGAWHAARFPGDLQQLTIDVIRPGGGRARFHTSTAFRPGTVRSTVIDLAAVKAGTIVLTAKDGATLRGLVVDEAGKPIQEAQLRARDATSFDPAHEFATDFEGKFELPNWEAKSVLLTAEKTGYQTKSATIELGGDGPVSKITLGPAKPLKLRLLGDNGMPLANAELQTDPNPSADHILHWKGVTDAEGRAEWSGAPDVPVNIWMSPQGYPHRTQKLTADGAEHVIQFRQGADKSISIRLRAVDAESGAPVNNFEVWRRLPSTQFKTWGTPVDHGEFKHELTADEMPRGYVPSYRLQIRAAGYTGWNSDSLDFTNGDQDLTLKLTKGEFTQANEPPPSRLPGQGMTGETNPALMVFAATVAQLLETGDVAAFVTAAQASEADWAALLPKDADPKTGPLGANAARILQRREKAVAESAEHLLALGRQAGVTPGRVRFTIKSVSAPGNSYSMYKVAGQEVKVPLALAIRVLLSGEPIGSDSGKSLRGDYELSIGSSHQLPAGWRAEEGVRWRAFPAGLADEATQRELRLVNLAAPASLSDRQHTISGADDVALLALGGQIAALLRDGGVPAFLAATTSPREEATTTFARYGWGTATEAEESHDRIAAGLTGATEALLALPRQLGVDFSDAKITVKQVLAEGARFTRFGQLDALRAEPVRVMLAVESARTTPSGRPLAGTYLVSAGEVLRLGERWVLNGDKIRWQEFPKDLLTPTDLKNLEFENYVAENHALPPGTPAPGIDYVRLADTTRVALSALRGKVVVLEFWASWCGPCQEPMEKLQHLRETHPDWKDRVEVLTVSIDDTAGAAAAHLAKKQWTSTTNAWAGEGAWSSPSAKAFRVRGVPTAYLLDANGQVVKAGHPLSLNFGELVDAQLRAAAR